MPINSHFRRPRDGQELELDYRPARSMWAQIERVEPPVKRGGDWLVALDAIGADWVRDQALGGNQYFNLGRPVAMRAARRDLSRQRSAGQRPGNPFENAPLYRIEVVQPDLWWTGLGPVDGEEVLEGLWFHISIAEPAQFGVTADVYANAFSPPLQTVLSFQPVRGEMEDALADLVSLDDDFDEIDEVDLASLISRGSADSLAVYHVGQGNSNGLLGHSAICGDSPPSIYYDLGCGVYGNHGTTPTPLEFCQNLDPPVLLSHWDSDHWMGVYAYMLANGTYPFLSADWVAPLQKVTTHHKAFALDVVLFGTIRIYKPPFVGFVGTAVLASPAKTTIEFTVGTGGGRNQSGIVLAIERDMTNEGKGINRWLLTGDSDYRYFTALTTTDLVGVVVPHHGASRPVKNPVVPPPKAGSAAHQSPRPYRRLVYSFGSGNTFSHGVTHPVDATVDEHYTEHWECAPWVMGSNPGSGLPGLDTRATSQNSVTGGAGVLVGWDSPPTMGSPCSTCSTRCSRN